MGNSKNRVKTPAQKLKIASDLFELAVKIKSYQIKRKHPDISDRELRTRVIKAIEQGGK